METIFKVYQQTTLTPDRRQSKTLIQSTNVDQNSWDLSPDWQQMAIESTVSKDVWSAFVGC